MNSKGTKTESIVHKRGFYVALYGCLAALLVLAVVISYNNYNAVKRARELRAQISADELLEASASTNPAYLTPEDRAGTQASPTPAPKPSPAVSGSAPSPAASPTPSPATNAGTQQKPSAPSAPPASPVPGTTDATPAEQPSAAAAPEATDATAETPADEQKPAQTPIRPSRSTSELSPPIFEQFAEGDSMSWPVLGEIVMDYSDERMVYDRTLEQFRTNEIMCIATEVGTPVHAASAGVVESVTQSREHGNTIVLDHGNGWRTTYSQLQDGVLVKAGDVVSTGQVIGGVGSPTLYYVLLGNHLGFQVACNEAKLDPKTVLE